MKKTERMGRLIHVIDESMRQHSYAGIEIVRKTCFVNCTCGWTKSFRITGKTYNFEVEFGMSCVRQHLIEVMAEEIDFERRVDEEAKRPRRNDRRAG